MNNNNNYRIANPKGKRLIIYFLNAKLQSHINVSTVMVAIFIEMVSFDFDINMMIIFSMFHRVYIYFFYQKKKKNFVRWTMPKPHVMNLFLIIMSSSTFRIIGGLYNH
jgi:hypothetical protein